MIICCCHYLRHRRVDHHGDGAGCYCRARGRLHPIGGLGVALAVTVLLFPVVQPYLLYDNSAGRLGNLPYRVRAILATLIVGISRSDRQQTACAVSDRGDCAAPSS